MARHWVGTSGWSYANWRGAFYPRGLKQGLWLAHYAERLRSVELNASFYRLPSPAFVAGWVERTPADFLFAVKAWQLITHRKHLRDCAQHLTDFYDRLDGLGPKFGPALFQLPPRFGVDPPRLEAFLEGLPAGRRHAFEFRDPSWHCEAVYDLLRQHGAAFCPFELAEQRTPRIVTADFVYVRLHGREGRYRGRYSPQALSGWARWLRKQMAEGRDAFVYFDNTDDATHALDNAQQLDRMLARR